MNLERRVGPASLRLWGLVANFFANALLLYGAVGYVSDGSRVVELALGAVATLTLIILLSAPSR